MHRELRKEMLVCETPAAANARYYWRLLGVMWCALILCMAFLADALLHQALPGLHLPAMANGFAVICTAVIFGRWHALAVALCVPFVHNFAAIEPLYQFDAPTFDEWALTAFYILFSFSIPWLTSRADRPRKWNDSFASGLRQDQTRHLALWQRSLAYHIAGELPDNVEDAKAILDAVQVMVGTPIDDDAKATVTAAPNVLPFAVG